MKKLHIVLATLLVLGLAACGGSEGSVTTPDPVTPSTGSNNSAVLSGSEIGNGYTSNSQLRKEISVGSTGINNTFRLGKAYATRDNADSETFYWFIAVTNQSSELQCFIKAEGLEFRDSSDQTLAVDEYTFVNGTVGMSPYSDFYTDTCLGNGETGYLVGIELDDNAFFLYSSVESVVIAALGSSSGFSRPDARIIPKSYSSELTVTVRNEGTGAARIGDFSRYFLLDDENVPLYWGFFDSIYDDLDDNPVLNPGDTYALADTLSLYSHYDGLASKVQPLIDFTSPTDTLDTKSPAFSAEAANTEAAKKEYLAWRSGLEHAKQQRLASLRRND